MLDARKGNVLVRMLDCRVKPGENTAVSWEHAQRRYETCFEKTHEGAAA